MAAKRAAAAATQWVSERAGKRECLWQESLGLVGVGSSTNPARRVYRLTERTIDKRGNALLLPEYVLEGWTTTLPAKFNGAEVIALYCDHFPQTIVMAGASIGGGGRGRHPLGARGRDRRRQPDAHRGVRGEQP